MYFPAVYKRAVANEDGVRTEVSADDDLVRVITDATSGKPAYLTNDEAQELIELLQEAVYANGLAFPRPLATLVARAQAHGQSCLPG